MTWGRLDSATGRLYEIRPQRDPSYADDVPLISQPSGNGPWTYDAVNQIAVSAKRVPRPLLDIITALTNLSAAQKTAVWNDVTSGTPPKWALDAGPNAAAIAWAPTLITLSTIAAADVLNIKIKAVAMYCQDVPRYLVQPAFDPSINIPGDQAG